MIITKLLREVDAELERLQTARRTIASLIASARPQRETIPPQKAAIIAPSEPSVPEPASLQETEPAEAPVSAQAAEPLPAAEEAPVFKRRRGRPKGSVNRRPGMSRGRAVQTPEPTALGPVRAAGPVFVSAAELERHRQRTFAIAPPVAHEVEAADSGGTLDALIREMAERRTAA